MKLNFAPVSLDQLKTATRSKVDMEAEATRLLFITPGAGQAMVYLQKEQEALAYLANTAIDETQIPHLIAEAAATGATVANLAQTVVTLSQQWRGISAKIEAARQKAAISIAAATSVSAVLTAGMIDWSAITTA